MYIYCINCIFDYRRHSRWGWTFLYKWTFIYFLYKWTFLYSYKWYVATCTSILHDSKTVIDFASVVCVCVSNWSCCYVHTMYMYVRLPSYQLHAFVKGHLLLVVAKDTSASLACIQRYNSFGYPYYATAFQDLGITT